MMMHTGAEFRTALKGRGRIGLALAALVLWSAPLRAQPATTPPADPAPFTLSQLPDVTVNYYDVSGNTTKKIRASIESQRPKDAAGKVQPSSSRWSIGTSLRKATTGAECKIVSVTAAMNAEVILPRLVNTGEVPEEVLKHWRKYVASLDQQQAAHLREVQARLPQVERAVMASSCEGARDAANKAIAEIAKQASASAAPQAQFRNPGA
jgi:predicted secreted Zn-dependent protease